MNGYLFSIAYQTKYNFNALQSSFWMQKCEWNEIMKYWKQTETQRKSKKKRITTPGLRSVKRSTTIISKERKMKTKDDMET